MNSIEIKIDTSSDIPSVSIFDLTPEIFNKHFRNKNLPVVIKGAFDALVPLDIPKICHHIGDMEVPIRHLGRNHFDKPKTEWKSRSDVRTGTVNEYCRLLENGVARNENIYLAIVDVTETPLYEILKPSLSLLAQNTGLKERLPTNTNLWFAPTGHTEPLHFDGGDGTLIQLRGPKKVSLFDPKHSAALYPFKIKDKGLPPTFSKVYINKPDYETYPKLQTAMPHMKVVTLQEGDTLFIPLGWWHEIQTMGDSYISSINRFWQIDPIWRMAYAPKASLFYIMSRLAKIFK